MSIMTCGICSDGGNEGAGRRLRSALRSLGDGAEPLHVEHPGFPCSWVSWKTTGLVRPSPQPGGDGPLSASSYESRDAVGKCL